MNYDREFYEETGYKVTFDAIEEESDSDPRITEIVNRCYLSLSEGRGPSVQKLEKYVREYPHVEEFKNYLYVVYLKAGKEEKAMEILMETIEKHPEYLFGKVNLAGQYIEKGKYKEADELLGIPRGIRTLIPERDVFHITEFLSYQKVAVVYDLAVGKFDEAKEKHELMVKIDPDDPQTVTIGYELIKARLKESRVLWEKYTEMKKRVESFPTAILESSVVPPSFVHFEIDQLYRYEADDLPEEVIKSIIELPRGTLIPDLEKVLEDGIRRYVYFYENYEEWKSEEQSFMVHALYFLGALEASFSLPKVLNVLRQGEEFLEYWFGDSFDNYFSLPMFLMAQNQLQALKSYVLEPNQSRRARNLAPQVVSQVALHYPERRREALDWFEGVFAHLLENPDDKNIIDTDFISWTVNSAIDLRPVELIPHVEALYEKNWIAETIIGNPDQIKEEIRSELDPGDIEPLPQDIYEFYSKEYKSRRVPLKPLPEFEKLQDSVHEKYMLNLFADIFRSKKMEELDEFDEFDEFYDDDDDYTPVERIKSVKRVKAKVGRNALCPCGSGKKYKKCCLNK